MMTTNDPYSFFASPFPPGHFRVRLAPVIGLLKHQRGSRIFQDKRIHEVVDEGLRGAGMVTRWELSREYPSGLSLRNTRRRISNLSIACSKPVFFSVDFALSVATRFATFVQWRTPWLRRTLILVLGRLLYRGRQWTLRVSSQSQLARRLN